MSIDDSTTPHSDRDAFAHWLSGFTDGEGSFNLNVQLKHGSRRRSPTLGARFKIVLRSDDRPILEEIREFLGVGTVYRIRRSGDRPGNGRDEPRRDNPAVTFNISVIRDLATIVVPHFERYPLRAKKARDFAIWKQGVEICHAVWQRRRKSRGARGGSCCRWGPADRRRFIELRDILNEGRRFHPSELVPCPPPEQPPPARLALFD